MYKTIEDINKAYKKKDFRPTELVSEYLSKIKLKDQIVVLLDVEQKKVIAKAILMTAYLLVRRVKIGKRQGEIMTIMVIRELIAMMRTL